MLVTSVVLAAGALGGTMLYGIHGRSAQVFGPSVRRGGGRRRSIALTFDDGPSEGSLPLLEYLHAEGIKATFFVCGMNVERHPSIARAIAQAEHEIGNHTYSHARLCPRLGWKLNIKSPEEIFHEFARTQGIIVREAGVTPVLLRAPYGMRWHGLRAAQRQLGLLGVMWTVIGHDWEWRAEAISKLVLRKATPGGIVCLHDGRDIQPQPDIGETLQAVKQIIPILKAEGYAFETVSELLRSDAEAAGAISPISPLHMHPPDAKRIHERI